MTERPVSGPSATREPLDWNLYRNELRGGSFLLPGGERASEVRPLCSHLRHSRSEGDRPICWCRALIRDVQRCRCIPDCWRAPNRSSFVSIGVGDRRTYTVAVYDARDDAAIQYLGGRRGVVSAWVPCADGLVAGPKTLDLQPRLIRRRAAPAVVAYNLVLKCYIQFSPYACRVVFIIDTNGTHSLEF